MPIMPAKITTGCWMKVRRQESGRPSVRTATPDDSCNRPTGPARPVRPVRTRKDDADGPADDQSGSQFLPISLDLAVKVPRIMTSPTSIDQNRRVLPTRLSHQLFALHFTSLHLIMSSPIEMNPVGASLPPYTSKPPPSHPSAAAARGVPRPGAEPASLGQGYRQAEDLAKAAVRPREGAMDAGSMFGMVAAGW